MMSTQPSKRVRLVGWVFVLLVYLVSAGAVMFVIAIVFRMLFGVRVGALAGLIFGAFYTIAVGIGLYRIIVRGELPLPRRRPGGGKLPKT